MKQHQIEWRRSQVSQLLSQAHSRSEICQRLQLDRVTVHRYSLHKQRGSTNTAKYIQKTIPVEFQCCLVVMNQVLNMAWSIVNKDMDNKTKLQALALINDCNKYKMDLATGDEAIRFVTQRKEQLDTLQKIR